MALNVKDEEAVRLAGEIAAITGESKTRAIRVAPQERRDRLRAASGAGTRGERLLRFLEREAWPLLPPEERGRPPLTKEEKEEILGYGEGGV